MAASRRRVTGGAVSLGIMATTHERLGAAAGAGAVAYPEHLRSLVEDYLTTLRFAREPGTAGLEEAMRYSLLAGGKRIRPVLALATARAIGRDPREVLPLAAAIELIHTFSLIHDDLPAIDDDDLRRGLPTSHRRFGEDVAILAGDALFAEAFRLVLREQRGDPAGVLAAVAELADATAVNGMVGGEYIDVRDLAGTPGVGLRRLHRLKTGRLIGAAVECVLLLSEVAASTQGELRAFAGELGVLFQIVDDILDVTGTDAELGKPRGSDERHAKLTYVSRYGLHGARAMAAGTHARALAALARAAPGGAPELEQIADLVSTRSS
ncbi:MAG: geranylgeranyl diphosphate synthase, type [Solirubrobacteraceae bacterium]|jgi:geranylgeranyl diphosphate synthase type II|nr:geranylgeranyl diphosphate synthase, type [Solirubrobacteraceae bacterium]